MYKGLHRLLHGRATHQTPPNAAQQHEHFIWIFCSTIGELNACKLLLQHYSALGNVLLLTDREIYLQSYQDQFPSAVIAVADLDFRHTAELIRRYPPQLAIVCEIPVLLHDAPCRLSYGVLRALKKQQVRICLVNGWLYGYQPACKQDSIEKLLFERDYLQCFDLLSVQTEEIRQVLLQRGAQADKVVVTGNMKYDNLDTSLALTAHTEALLEVLKPQRPLFVAGCVTNIWEYQLVVAAYASARKKLPALKLIIAPRHPEKPEQLSALQDLMQQYQLQYDFRSHVSAANLQLKDVLIIDTFGELKALYSVADACYVGINHNILEPLSLNKPVAVLGDWEKTYPSYPVFRIAEQASMVTIVSDADALTRFLMSAVADDSTAVNVATQLNELSGALAKNIDLITR
jgi:3-deoxy-D-manno-octulosonic-acid transferase